MADILFDTREYHITDPPGSEGALVLFFARVFEVSPSVEFRDTYQVWTNAAVGVVHVTGRDMDSANHQ